MDVIAGTIERSILPKLTGSPAVGMQSMAAVAETVRDGVDMQAMAAAESEENEKRASDSNPCPAISAYDGGFDGDEEKSDGENEEKRPDEVPHTPPAQIMRSMPRINRKSSSDESDESYDSDGMEDEPSPFISVKHAIGTENKARESGTASPCDANCAGDAGGMKAPESAKNESFSRLSSSEGAANKDRATAPAAGMASKAIQSEESSSSSSESEESDGAANKDRATAPAAGMASQAIQSEESSSSSSESEESDGAADKGRTTASATGMASKAIQSEESSSSSSESEESDGAANKGRATAPAAGMAPKEDGRATEGEVKIIKRRGRPPGSKSSRQSLQPPKKRGRPPGSKSSKKSTEPPKKRGRPLGSKNSKHLNSDVCAGKTSENEKRGRSSGRTARVSYKEEAGDFGDEDGLEGSCRPAKTKRKRLIKNLEYFRRKNMVFDPSKQDNDIKAAETLLCLASNASGLSGPVDDNCFPVLVSEPDDPPVSPGEMEPFETHPRYAGQCWNRIFFARYAYTFKKIAKLFGEDPEDLIRINRCRKDFKTQRHKEMRVETYLAAGASVYLSKKPDLTFRCQKCGQVFGKDKDLKRHQKALHSCPHKDRPETEIPHIKRIDSGSTGWKIFFYNKDGSEFNGEQGREDKGTD